MKNRICLLVAVLIMASSQMALAELCKKCQGMMTISSIGKCTQCQGHTASGAYKLCKQCSTKLKKCQLCGSSLSHADNSKKPEKVKQNKYGPTLQIDQSMHRQSVVMQVGQQVRVSLPSNPSTGYGWQVQSLDKNMLKPVGDMKYVAKITDQQMPGSVPIVGSGGTATLLFVAKRTGRTQLKMVYARSWEKDKKPAKTFNLTIEVVKASTSLKAELISKTTKYPLRDDLAKLDVDAIKKLVKNRGKLPEPIKVDLVMKLTNKSKKPVTFLLGSDQSKVMLTLEGKGAVSVTATMMMTMEFRMGKSITLKPGQSHEIKLAHLKYGMRGITKRAYWTKLGQYKLTASYLGVSPKPGTNPMDVRMDKFIVFANPVTIEVAK